MATKKKMLMSSAGAGGAGGAGLDVAEVFSTYLYDGNGATQTITNDIDLAGEGGLVWGKSRTDNGVHSLYDTERGVQKPLFSNATNAQGDDSAGGSTSGLYQFNSDGFNLGSDWAGNINVSGQDMASWTFRKAPKFFDVVTYTGTGSAQNIAHDLGSVPGMIIVKRTSSTEDWLVYHRSTGNQAGTGLNETAATYTGVGNVYWNSTDPTDSVFTVGTHARVNTSGQTYVAYLFAHNDGDGGFGPDGDADIIKCGSYSQSSASDVDVDLGFEPQFVIVKRSDDTSQWYILDEMRGFLAGSNSTSSRTLYASLANAEADFTIQKTATGFTWPSGQYGSGTQEYIYIAIRRGPLAQPDIGTEVFDVYAGNDASYKIPTGFVTDLVIGANRSGGDKFIGSRLTGLKAMRTNTTQAEGAGQPFPTDAWQYNDGVKPGFFAASTAAYWLWKRAPGFFDVVAYTGVGTAGRTVSHNLGVEPEMMWIKGRNYVENWAVYHKDVGATKYLMLNQTSAESTSTIAWNDTAPTSSVFTLGGWNAVNENSYNYIAYLFATVPGVSKVGSYTGDGTTDGSKVIDCGFTSGARFVLIKRSDGGGSWYVWDTARGIVAGNDPRLELNSTNEEASFDNVDPHSSGFSVVGSSINNINGGNYIFYAIA